MCWSRQKRERERVERGGGGREGERGEGGGREGGREGGRGEREGGRKRGTFMTDKLRG